MEKVSLRFYSSEGASKVLRFELYSHAVARRWETLVKKAHALGISYKSFDFRYGGDRGEIPVALEDLNTTVSKLSNEFPRIWGSTSFDTIRGRKLTSSQKDLNTAHIFFEMILKNVETSDFEKIMSNEEIQKEIGHLNYVIHFLESLETDNPGFFYDFSLGPPYLRVPLRKEETTLFSPNRLWGEVYLGYPHVGENPLEAFTKDYEVEPTLQTLLAGNFIINFMPDYIFDRHHELREWLKNKTTLDPDLEKLPIGLIPIGKVESSFTHEDAWELRKKFPLAGQRLDFLGDDL